MSSYRKTLFTALFVGLLVLSAGVVAAQQGNGNQGDGNRGNNAGGPNMQGNAEPQGNCLDEPQMNAFRNGGMGFVNPQTGEGWNGQQRGRMNRGAGENGVGFYVGLPPATVDELPQEIVDLMIEGWLDEQNAYATYESIMAQFGEVTPFVNIQQAEVQHAAAWEFLFDRYDIDLPELPDTDIPQFESVAAACAAGAEAEIVNFSLYDTMLAAFEEYPDIYQVALSLRNASEFNHLPAFENCAG